VHRGGCSISDKQAPNTAATSLDALFEKYIGHEISDSEFVKAISRFAYRVAINSGCKTDVDEIASDVSFKVLCAITAPNFSRLNFSGFVYRIARRKAIDAFRSQHGRVATSPRRNTQTSSLADLAQEPAASQPDALSQIAAKERSAHVWAAVAKLDGRQRIVMQLTLQENTFREIADMLGAPEATIKTNYYRALVTLRKILNLMEDRHEISSDTLSGGDALQV